MMCVLEQEIPHVSTDTPTKQGVFPHHRSILASLFYEMAVVVSAERPPFLSKVRKTLFCPCLCCAAAHFSLLSLNPVSQLPSV